ncbi:MAG: hypothetical protein LUI60_04085 [Clostridia bacterium]|nr:hypothetical protein [Clostridia bacterium]
MALLPGFSRAATYVALARSFGYAQDDEKSDRPSVKAVRMVSESDRTSPSS